MAKKKNSGVPNKAMYTRISFLYQAAMCMAEAHEQADATVTAEQTSNLDKNIANKDTNAPTQPLSRQLLTDLRAVTLKSQIRISPEIKRTICKYCDALLVEGHTSSSVVENKSKGGKKPWADVLVIKCHTCGREKRYPVNAQRQVRRSLRSKEPQPKKRHVS